MNVRNCRRCRRIFNDTMGPIYCMPCKQELEEEFQVVKKYVQENPGSDIRMVAEACNIEPSQIKQWVREERLYFTEGSNTGISCEHCGMMIRTGRFCERCKSEMSNSFKAASRPAAPAQPQKSSHRAETNRMRFLDNK